MLCTGTKKLEAASRFMYWRSLSKLRFAVKSQLIINSYTEYNFTYIGWSAALLVTLCHSLVHPHCCLTKFTSPPHGGGSRFDIEKSGCMLVGHTFQHICQSGHIFYKINAPLLTVMRILATCFSADPTPIGPRLGNSNVFFSAPSTPVRGQPPPLFPQDSAQFTKKMCLRRDYHFSV